VGTHSLSQEALTQTLRRFLAVDKRPISPGNQPHENNKHTAVPALRHDALRNHVVARSTTQQQQQPQPQPQQQQQQQQPTTPPEAGGGGARLRPGETAEQAAERRARESLRVEERVDDVASVASWRAALRDAGDRLVVLEVEAEGVCQTGLEEEADVNWELDKKAALVPCARIKPTLQRTARECPDVVFLSLSVETDEATALAAELGVEVLPSLQFWRRGKLLWEHRGVLALEQDLGEGVLYFGGAARGGVDAREHVAELRSRAELEAFVANAAVDAAADAAGAKDAAAADAGPPAAPDALPASAPPDQVLSVVDVCTAGASPCIHVYPAVVALARSFKGYARFGRLLADDQPELLRALGVVEVPTFIFYRGGEEVARHVGSSRGDLMGRIMEVQAEYGVRPPPPPSAAAGAKRRVPERRAIKRRV